MLGVSKHIWLLPTVLLVGVMIVNGFVLRPPVSILRPPSSLYQQLKYGHSSMDSRSITTTNSSTALLMSSSPSPSSSSSCNTNGVSNNRKDSKQQQQQQRRGKRNYFKFIKDTRNKSQKSVIEVSSTSSETMAMTLPYPNTKRSPQQILQKIITSLFELTEVGKWRMAAATFITSIVAFQPKIDVALVHFWSWLQNDTTALLPRCFRHDHWEWMVAIWAFFFWIHGYWLADRAIAKADVGGGPVHPWKKYRLQDEYEAEKQRRKELRMTMKDSIATTTTTTTTGGDGQLSTLSSYQNQQQQQQSHQQQAAPPSAPTKQQKWHTGFWIFELPLYVLPLYIWDITIPRRAAKIACWSAPTAFRICKDVSCGLLLYDLGFFVCHYFMHKIPILYKYVHAKHHTSKEVRASDIVRLSFVEEIVDVGISILALNFLKAHPISRTIYNVIITFLLTELHCGFAFPWTPQFVVPFGLATGSKGHHYHHRNGRHYYQKFFCHVDRLFGFVQKKDETLQGSTI